MVKVTLNGHPEVVLAESDKTIVIEGNHYFPPDSVHKSLFKESSTSTRCPWKGQASYYNAALSDGTTVPDVAWYYPNALEAAKNIKDYVAFYKTKTTIV
ncbi:hypothetical protein BOTBODRAFT_177589 [Botryobasidium botryosum FD-172 SS1]|uniref:DUF427 domain-containing protein n=1 Tax=Botryobasidium botryosum (strain FD-172 SS1) TaxID=930990 RepID=A0A067MGU3_BOTB1|nr:hypothetical protein BOTBODRAFT_177589 [Botryobasidium botryosum FD-172 SS1]